MQARMLDDDQISTTDIGLFNACHTDEYNKVVIRGFNFGTHLYLKFG